MESPASKKTWRRMRRSGGGGGAPGTKAMKELLTPLAGKIHIERYEMIAPKVQRRGDMAVLSYQVVSHIRKPDGQPDAVHWNSTAVYARAGSEWKIIHSHFSYTQGQRPR